VCAFNFSCVPHARRDASVRPRPTQLGKDSFSCRCLRLGTNSRCASAGASWWVHTCGSEPVRSITHEVVNYITSSSERLS
jgi:hypothetical protein